MTKKRLLINFLGVICSLLFIWYGGTFISSIAERSYRKNIDKNGVYLKAVVTKKRYLKGRYVFFEYTYSGRQYSNKELNRDYYKSLIIGDTIGIMVDSSNPGDSYISVTGIR